VALRARGRSEAARVAVLVATEATLHARHLIARRELQLTDLTVALLALDVLVEVRLVVHLQVGDGDLDLLDLDAAGDALRAEVAEVAARAGLIGLPRIGLVDRVASDALAVRVLADGDEHVRRRRALRRERVTEGALQLLTLD